MSLTISPTFFRSWNLPNVSLNREVFFNSDNKSDARQGIPIPNLIRPRLIRNDEIFIVKHIVKNRLKFC